MKIFLFWSCFLCLPQAVMLVCVRRETQQWPYDQTGHRAVQGLNHSTSRSFIRMMGWIKYLLKCFSWSGLCYECCVVVRCIDREVTRAILASGHLLPHTASEYGRPLLQHQAPTPSSLLPTGSYQLYYPHYWQYGNLDQDSYVSKLWILTPINY